MDSYLHCVVHIIHLINKFILDFPFLLKRAHRIHIHRHDSISACARSHTPTETSFSFWTFACTVHHCCVTSTRARLHNRWLHARLIIMWYENRCFSFCQEQISLFCWCAGVCVHNFSTSIHLEMCVCALFRLETLGYCCISARFSTVTIYCFMWLLCTWERVRITLCEKADTGTSKCTKGVEAES